MFHVMKYQVLFALKNNDKIFKTSSATVVIGAQRVKTALNQRCFSIVDLEQNEYFGHISCNEVPVTDFDIYMY